MSGTKKKAQVSMEIMYAVGVLLIIFLILSGVSYNRKLDVNKAEDFLNKRNDCLMLSNKLSEISVLGEGYYTTFQTRYNITIWGDGLLLVGEVGGTEKDQDVYCTYVGNGTNYSEVTGWYNITGLPGTINITRCWDQANGQC